VSCRPLEISQVGCWNGMELPVDFGQTTDNTLGSPLSFAHSLASLNLGINDPVTWDASSQPRATFQNYVEGSRAIVSITSSLTIANSNESTYSFPKLILATR
jgi:hypothetical protein